MLQQPAHTLVAELAFDLEIVFVRVYLPVGQPRQGLRTLTTANKNLQTSSMEHPVDPKHITRHKKNVRNVSSLL